MPPESIEPRVEAAFLNAFANAENYLRRILEDLATDKGIVVRDALNIERIDAALREIRTQMDALGYRDAVYTELNGLTELFREAKKEAESKGFDKKWKEEFVATSRHAVRMLLEGTEAELVQVGNQAAEDVSALLRRSITGTTEYKDLIGSIQRKLEIKRHQAMTLAVTALHSFNSSVRFANAKEAGIEWFRYRGPDDKVTRDWCGHWINRIGTAKMFENTADKWGRKGQPVPVMTWRGGYNCRHRFDPVLEGEVDEHVKGPR